MGKHKQRSFVPQYSAKKPTEKRYLNRDPSIMRGWSAEGNSATVFLSIRFVQNDFQCFCEWDKNDMQAFWSFNKILHNHTWSQVYASGGDNDKTGLGYTPIDPECYPTKFREDLEPDLT